MTANGESEHLKLSFGLITSGLKYLTAEKFAYKVSASGTSLKTKQIWHLEQSPEGNVVYFKSWLGKYLASDRNGIITCDDAEPGEENGFLVEATVETGRWAIKSAKHKTFFGIKDGEPNGFCPSIDSSTLWTVHLAMHPQINLWNGRRKRYAILEDNEVRMNKPIPWGPNALITLVFADESYALMLPNGTYLACDGSLQPKLSNETAYTIEFYDGKIAFKSKANKKYLTHIGPKGVLQTRKDTPTTDEHFSFVDAHPQISLKSTKKDKYVSGKQGLQLSANQIEADETEIFQLEMEKGSDKVWLQNDRNKYWRVAGNAIQADGASACAEGSDFNLTWNGRKLQLGTNNGKHVSVALSGHLQVGPQAEEFVWSLTNRPIIVFRGSQGFIGVKGEKLEGNRSKYDLFYLEYMDGAYAIRAPSGKYWTVRDDKVVMASSDTKQPFLIQLQPSSKLAIKPETGGDYITSDHVGIMKASVATIGPDCLWEY
uniref:Fascin n=1 Tax=Phallusia mammillata TaxID=59560 RepID=A0A6F9DDB9_9ASCI|nr:fascin-like [Phallusia mammillata]